MIRSAGFKRAPARPARQWEGDALPGPRAPAERVVSGDARMVVQLPKGPKAKPGKRTPNKAEAEWMDKIVAYGCVACRIDGHFSRPAVHHILRGGVRLGHLFTIPLCDPGHHQGGGAIGLVSRHPWKARFEARYGTELELLEKMRKELA